MMGMKRGKFSLVIFILLMFIGFLGLVYAQSLDNIQQGLDKVDAAGKILSDQEATKQYLSQEWSKIMQNSSVGVTIVKTEEVVSKFNPGFNLFLGTKFSLSWLFLINLAFWIFFVSYLYQILRIIKIYFNFPFISLLFLAISIIVISVLRLSLLFTNFSLSLISNIGNFFFVNFAAAILFIFLLLFSGYSGYIGKVVKKTLEKKDIRKAKEIARSAKKEVGKLEKSIEKDGKRGKDKSGENDDKDIEEEARKDIEGLGESEEN